MLHKVITLTPALLLVSATGLAQVKLEHKLTEGSTYTVQTVSSIDQTLTIAGNGTETKSEIIATSEATVGKRDGEGNIPVTQKTKSLQISIGGTAGEYRFDSANPDDKGGSPLEILRDVHKALATQTKTVVHDKDNRVVEIKSDDDTLSKLPEQVQALARSQLDPDYQKEAANQGLDIIPSEPVKKGDSWERTSTADFGAGQSMEFVTKYTYEGTVESGGRTLDKISAETVSVKFSLADDSPLPIDLKDSELKVTESENTVLFDREAGAIVESKETIRIEGEITFEANGQELPSELDLKIKSEVTVQS